MMKKTSNLTDFLYIPAASILFAMGYNMFIEPAGIVLGGATGVATVLNRLFPFLSVGTYILLVNLPLLLVCLKVFGKRFIWKTAVGTLCSSVALDLLNFFPVTTSDPLLCSLFGGGSIGAALGLMYARGYNTGGADLLVFLLKRRHKNLSDGKIVMLLDAAVVIFSALILKTFSLIFYSVITICAETAVLDRVINGFDRGQLAFIFSENSNVIAEKISTELERGVTVIDATGWYTGKNGQALLCALRPGEVYKLRGIIGSVDPRAFVVFTSASAIDGLGFERNAP